MSTGSEELIEVRYIVQKVLMPIIFVIGLIGNSITVLVLTRKPMRCSTNVYLTALAIVDMFYLTMAFLLTLRHFNSIHYHPAYWQCIGLIIWLNDGFSYISIYIAVSFTIERYIAVRYPIRRKTYCTEALAKKVICGIVIFCLATTISTAFEYEVNTKSNCETKNEIPSNSNSTNEDAFVGRHLEDYNEQQNDTLNLTSISAISTNILLNQKDCPKPFYYDVTESIFGSNENYRNIFFVYTMIFFVIIPLIILVTFNTFLVILVRQSKLIRSQMTQKSIRTNESVRRPNLSIKFNKNATISQENKITIVLIAVVIVFVICQLPWSIFMIYNQYVNMPIYLSLVFGNIGNLLVAINAASNFFLYCLLSDKYRKTVKDIIMGRNKHKRKDLSYHIRKDPLSWSSHNKHNITTSNINNKNSTYHDLATEKLILNNNNNCQQQITNNNNNNNNNLSLNKNEFLKLPSTNRKYPRLLQHSISLTSSFNNTHQFNDDINNRQYQQQQQQHHHHLLQQDSLKHSKYCPLYRIRSKNIRNNNHNHQYSIGLNDNSISSWIPYKIRNQFIKLNNNNKYNDNIQETSVKTTDTDNNNDEDNNNNNNNSNNNNTISIKRSQSLTLIPKTRHSPCCKDYLE